MNHHLEITIYGNPIAKKRPRFFRRGNHVGTYNDQTTEEGRFLLATMAQLESVRHLLPIPKGAPVELLCWFEMPIPKTLEKKFAKGSGDIRHTKKPDLDNLVKFVKDCLNKQVWHDDSQVVFLRGVKYYGHDPKTTLEIKWIA